MMSWFLGSFDYKNGLASQEDETPFSCANLLTSPTPRMDPPGDPEAQTGVNEHQPTPPNDTVDDYADPSGKLWSMYLTEADTEDGQMTKNWTKDTQGVLVFVSFKAWFYICSMY